MFFHAGICSNRKFFPSFPLQPEETLVEKSLGSCSPSARKWSRAIGFSGAWKNGKGGQRTRSEKIDFTGVGENPVVARFLVVVFKPINSQPNQSSVFIRDVSLFLYPLISKSYE